MLPNKSRVMMHLLPDCYCLGDNLSFSLSESLKVIHDIVHGWRLD